MPSAAIEAAAAESELIREALEMAERAHAGQTRNGSGGMAYIHHPVAVAELLAEHGFGEQTVAAALLHDVVEDSETSVEDVAERFGQPVAALVAALTEDESIEPYERRKDAHRRQVAQAGRDAPAIYGADKLSNIRVLRRALAQEGESAGEEFEVPLKVKERIWADDMEMLRREAPLLPFAEDLASELAKLREARSSASQADPAPRRS
ncbi:MAG TPA: HD domain-containing protein [Solirubrobacterales bacterium]|jgi:(p)ppGpp synthase/HD superfamily hydrolase|nr:HD domain-containing protein [Solirubrobacterales bacterium]